MYHSDIILDRSKFALEFVGFAFVTHTPQTLKSRKSEMDHSIGLYCDLRQYLELLRIGNNWDLENKVTIIFS